MQNQPDREHRSREQYRKIAARYDRKLQVRLGEGLRRRAFRQFPLKTGDTVVDVGCGTGLSFAHIEGVVGASGRLVGIEPSAQMLTLARARVTGEGWSNVTLIYASADDAVIPEGVDAIVIFRVHEVMRSPAALRNVFRSARTGAHVLAVGVKWAPWWMFPLNLAILMLTRSVTTTRQGFRRPWDLMMEFVPDLQVTSVALGGHYFAFGTTPTPTSDRSWQPGGSRAPLPEQVNRTPRHVR